MIISDDQKFIFIHNPKCAGTTVRKSLKVYNSRGEAYWMFDHLEGKKIDKAHMPLSVFMRYSFEDFRLLESYFTFGFVRNPYRRFISAFNETHKTLWSVSSDPDGGGEKYRAKINEFALSLKGDRLTGMHFQFRHCVVQNTMFYLSGKCYADLVLKLENLSTEVQKLKILCPPVYQVAEQWGAHLNQKPMTQKVSDILNSESLKILQEVYRDDFVLFDYDPRDLDL
jgi:hypothetical protein